MTNPTELAAMPATQGHIARAKEAVRANPAKQGALDALLASNPTRGQMVDFLESLHTETAAEQLDRRIDAICKAAGIEAPTGADRLMAMQVGLLQDQNMILQNGLTRSLNQMRSDAKSREANSDDFTALMGAAMLGAILLR